MTVTRMTPVRVRGKQRHSVQTPGRPGRHTPAGAQTAAEAGAAPGSREADAAAAQGRIRSRSRHQAGIGAVREVHPAPAAPALRPVAHQGRDEGSVQPQISAAVHLAARRRKPERCDPHQVDGIVGGGAGSTATPAPMTSAGHRSGTRSKPCSTPGSVATGPRRRAGGMAARQAPDLPGALANVPGRL